MTTFKQARDRQARIPEKHVIIKPSMFSDDWAERPAEEVALGLRRVSEADIQTARAEAAKVATELHDDRQGQVEAFNDALMRWAIVRGTCDANDVMQIAPMFMGDENNVRAALTSQGIRYVWDEIERYHIECSPIVPEATDEELAELTRRIGESRLPMDNAPEGVVGYWDVLSSGAKRRFLKLAKFLLDELREADPKYTEEPEEEEAQIVVELDDG